LETVEPLRSAGIAVEHIAVLIDRQHGAAANLKAHGLTLHAVCTVSQVLDVLQNHGRITALVADEVRAFIVANQVESISHGPPKTHSRALSLSVTAPLNYGQRAEQCNNAVGKRLLSLMHDKHTNLCLSADVTTSAELVRLATICGPHIVMLKTHIDIVVDFTPQLINTLLTIASEMNFLIFEDRKFADIGNTVAMQYGGGMYRIAEWADVTNAHLLPGRGVIDGIASAAHKLKSPRALLLIGEMSSEGSLCRDAYTDATVAAAESSDSFVMGFICQKRLSKRPGLIHCTPGVQLPSDGAATGDGLGQSYNSPATVIGGGSDIIIVGRGIYAAAGAEVEQCKRYQQAGWDAYLKRIAL